MCIFLRHSHWIVGKAKLVNISFNCVPGCLSGWLAASMAGDELEMSRKHSNKLLWLQIEAPKLIYSNPLSATIISLVAALEAYSLVPLH